METAAKFGRRDVFDAPRQWMDFVMDLRRERESLAALKNALNDALNDVLKKLDTFAAVNRVARPENDYRSEEKLRVKVPTECFSFIAPLGQRGFNIIDKIAPTYIVLRKDKSRAEDDDSQKKTILRSPNDLYKVAPRVTLMPRETIASSPKPHNPNPKCVVYYRSPRSFRSATLEEPQTLLPECGCAKQSDELQHSSWAYPSNPVGLGNGNEGVGLLDFSARPETPVQPRYRPHPANKSDKFLSKRLCGLVFGLDFEDKAKALLQGELEYLTDPTNEDDDHDGDSCSLLWDTRTKGRDAIISELAPQIPYQNPLAICSTNKLKTPQGTSYWDLTMDTKKAYKKDHDRHFPLTFEREWVVAMEKIEKLEQRNVQKDGQEGESPQSWPSTITGRANLASTDCLEETGDEPDLESEEVDIPTDEEGLSSESGASVESHTEIASADSHGPRSKPSRMRSAASPFDEESLFAKIRPFVNQQIEEALLPLISALRSREEDEHNHRQKMLGLEREKLALMRQKLESTRPPI